MGTGYDYTIYIYLLIKFVIRCSSVLALGITYKYIVCFYWARRRADGLFSWGYGLNQGQPNEPVVRKFWA
jgi:hypothetical protein